MSQNLTPATQTTKSFDATAVARKIVLTALVVHLLSLFLPYRDSSKEGDIYYMEKHHVVGIQGMSKELTGFEELPYAKWVIIGLLVLFGTDLWEEKVWRRWVYWAAVALLISFAFGGAPLRTSGGKLSMLCIGAVIVAAWLNERGLKKQRADISLM